MRKTFVVLATAALLGGTALSGSAVARDRADRVELSANQINDQFSARAARIKADLRLTPEQEKNWSGFASVMSDIGKTSADRQIALRTERTQQSPPIDIIEQMRRDSKFLGERSADQKTLADAAQPLFATLNDQQKRRFTEELRGLSRWTDID
jgi:hypothetical protein